MAEKSRILVVDDDVDFVESTKDLLEAHGYDVSYAYDGEAGLKKATEKKPDLMVLDVMMASKTEGFEVARKIPENPVLRDIPVIMVTGIRREMKLGYGFEPDESWLPVKTVMEKPVDPAQFIATIDKTLKNQSA